MSIRGGTCGSSRLAMAPELNSTTIDIARKASPARIGE